MPIETDYLVIGAGAAAMSFVDTLLAESDAQIVMADRHHRPGGHWNDAYPFVTLHQPADLYGVCSRALSLPSLDEAGVNTGMQRLASGSEVLAYFDQVMQQRFLASGRVRFLPKSEVGLVAGGNPRVRSLLTGEETQVVVRRKIVNATHAMTAVPATHPPKYDVAPGVACVPPNSLPEVQQPYAGYTVVGSGKTGMDACLWLLQNGVEPSRIRWIMPRDAWFLDRACFQTGIENLKRTLGNTIGQFEAIAEATSMVDLFARLEARGALLRIDPSVEPTTYRCATVSRPELAQLRRIEEIVRLGRVISIAPSRIVLERGELPAVADTLYVDCSASAIQIPPKIPVFDGDTINLLMAAHCQPLFSAALIAYVESHLDDPGEKNALCRPVPSPVLPIDWLRMWGATLANMAKWRTNPEVNAWVSRSPLYSMTAFTRGMKPDDGESLALIKAVGSRAQMAAEKIPALLAGRARN